jgi:hypothetical protein
MADPTFADWPLARRLSRWCKEALRLKKRWDELPDAAYEMRASRLEDRLDALARAAPPDDHADARRLRKRLARHRAELTRFLWDRDLDGTNDAAERALRPGGRHAQGHRRQPQQAGSGGMGDAGQPDAHRRPTRPGRVRRDEEARDGLLGGGRAAGGKQLQLRVRNRPGFSISAIYNSAWSSG